VARGDEDTAPLCQNMSRAGSEDGSRRITQESTMGSGGRAWRPECGALAIGAAFDHNPRFSHDFRQFQFA
jgi:hypothetical protein